MGERGTGNPSPTVSKEDFGGQGCHDEAGQVCDEGGGDAVAGLLNAGSAEVDGDGVKGGFGGA